MLHRPLHLVAALALCSLLLPAAGVAASRVGTDLLDGDAAVARVAAVCRFLARGAYPDRTAGLDALARADRAATDSAGVDYLQRAAVNEVAGCRDTVQAARIAQRGQVLIALPPPPSRSHADEIIASLGRPADAERPKARTRGIAVEDAGPPSARPAPSTTETGADPLFFPWPPYQASTRADLAVPKLRDGGAPKTLGDVADVLKQALADRGYDEHAFFSTPDRRGFAVVTRLERFGDGGLSAQGQARFDHRIRSVSANPFDWLVELIGSDVGRYRSIVFLVSTRPVSEDPEKSPDRSLTERWMKVGTQGPSDVLAAVPLTPAHRLYVLVYEFVRRGANEPEFVDRSSLTASAHLAASGLRKALAP